MRGIRTLKGCLSSPPTQEAGLGPRRCTSAKSPVILMLQVQGTQVEPPATHRPFFRQKPRSNTWSFNKHLLSTYYVLSPTVSTVGDKANRWPCPGGDNVPFLCPSTLDNMEHFGGWRNKKRPWLPGLAWRCRPGPTPHPACGTLRLCLARANLSSKFSP